jgi:peptidoglycan/xylan/chitin deacetylase (PgdA/CDA1 family)
MRRVGTMKMHKILQKDQEIWDLFTRDEEYHASIRDKFNRFPYYASKNRDIFEPIASKFLIENGYHVEYPDGKPFAVCLTHDIDDVYTSITAKGISAVKNLASRKFDTSLNTIQQVRSKKIPYVNFEEIMNLEERYDAQSSFFVLALDPSDQDYQYTPEHFTHELGIIQDRGWEIGLHAGHQGYRDLNKLMTEKKNLEKVINNRVVGCRNHYLNFIVPDSWEILHEAGFVYDCSFGYADCTGFRNGMCHPFRPYNLHNEKIIDILEIPLVIMDGSLFEDYMRLDTGTAWELTRRLIDTVAGYHGVITLVWHNTTLAGEQRIFYEKILNYCSEMNAWMTSGEQICTWWRQHIKN